MNKKRFELQFDAKMEISDIKKQLSALSGSLDKLEIPASIAKNLERALTKTLDQLNSFESLSEKGIETLADTKKLEKSWAQVMESLNTIGATLKSMDATKLFPKEAQKNIEAAEKAMANYIQKLEQAKKTPAYQVEEKKRDDSLKDERTAQELLDKAKRKLMSAEAEFEAKKGSWNEEAQQRYAAEQTELEEINKKLKTQEETLKRLNKEKEQLRAEGYMTAEGEVSVNARRGKEGFNDPKKLKRAETVASRLKTATSTKKDYEGMQKDVKGRMKESEALEKEYKEAERAVQETRESVEQLTVKLKEAQEATKVLEQAMENIAKGEAATFWKELLQVLQKIPGLNLDESAQDIEAIKQALQGYRQDELDKAPEAVEKLKQELKETEAPAKKVDEALDGVVETAKDMEKAADEIEHLKQQILDFFSISNAISIFKRALSDAFQTVKELDAVMTEAAVVTDFSIGDMWEQMPQYSKNASDLGVATKELYAATTLYYQQGLKGNEVVRVGAETMKMAKIANMDATEATQAMTAALRGFNMQVDEMNAQKVNDVYSKLAAVTAADTSQIATAMSKTASIAASANMEFETTAAFLAQIIETTQEAPETAGTALKTIIARFGEVKQLQNQGLASGVDAEGEAIDINKISTALRSVGISMDAFFAGQEGLDDVLLRLSEKWNTLDFQTQHYIATMAAGSRQQSRFIAMMSNYSRTMELVNDANNSAGASQEQYEKTLDSLDSKLAQLKNAWDQFTMGLANEELVKFGVDTLTWILETVNKITEALSGGNGLIKSVVSLSAVISGLKLGGKILGKNSTTGGLFGKIGGKLGIKDNSKQEYQRGIKDGKAYGKGWKGGVEEATKGMPAPEFVNETNNEQINETAKRLDTMALAAMGVAAAAGLIGQAFEEAGMEDAAAAADAIAGTFSVIGTILPTLTGLFKLMGKEAALAGVVSSLGWGWVAAIAAGIMVVVAAIGIALKNAEQSTLECKLEKAQEATENAKKAAEEAKTAYDDLLSAKDSYNGLQRQLEGLTEGTIEWKRVLIDSKQQVLDLIKQYPKLAQHVKQGKYGLEIDDSGWEYLNQEAARRLQAAQANQVGASIIQAITERNVFLEDMALNGLSGYTAQDMEGLVENYLANGLNVQAMIDELEMERTALENERERYSPGNASVPQTSAYYKMPDPEYVSLSTDIGKLDAQISYLGNNFEDWVDEYALRIETYTEQLKAYTQQLAVYVSDKNQGLDYFTKVSVAIADNQYDMFEKKKKDRVDELKEQYATDESGLKRLYEDTFGMTPDEQLKTEDMINAIAYNEISIEFSKLLDNILNAISRRSNADAIATAISGNVSNITVDELKKASEIDVSAMSYALGYTYDTRGDMLASLGMTEEEYNRQQEALAKRYEQVISSFGGAYGINKDFIEGLKIESAEQLLRQFELGGLTTVNQKHTLITALQNVLTTEGLNPEGRVKLENTLANTNWADPFQGLDAMDAMLAEGVSLKNIKKYWDAATAGVQSYVDTEAEALQLASRMQGKVKNLGELSNRMTEGTMTVDDMVLLEKAGVDTSSYKLTAEGWQATAQETEAAMETMKAYYLMQAEKQKEEIELEQKTVGITEERKAELDETLAIVEKTIEMLEQPITTTYKVETHIDLLDRIKEAIVFDRQKEIDKLSEINDTIADSNSRIVTAMRESVEDSRRMRENERTEQEIADKQARLSYLKMDTSGANAMEIKQLEEEIAQDQESYTDRLIDEKISALEEQNNIAQEQRAQQIELMQLQLEQDKTSGAFWGRVNELFKAAYNSETGKLNEDSEAVRLLQQAEGYQGLSAEAQQQWKDDLLSAFKEGVKVEVDVDIKIAGGGIGAVSSGNLGAGPGLSKVVAVQKFASGGLADFTGPAWLDGTKTNPEYVLSAAQTERFFTLVDILEGLKAAPANSTQNNRENNFDIDINVESINSDYDVEQVAIKVKDFIVNSSRYRNNNTL